MGLPPQLEKDLALLRDRGLLVKAQRDGAGGNQIYITIDNYSLPEGWNRKSTQVLLITDVSYPNSKMDMFWVEPWLTLPDGRKPQAGEAIETYLSRPWQRFSWHVQKWNPAVDSVVSYLNTVKQRLLQRQ